MVKKIQSLQSLRGIAFLLIFFSHCTFIELFPSTWGAIGVSIFVVLSGFVVTINPKYQNPDFKLHPIPYTLKRVGKIFPLHMIMLCVRMVYDYLFYGLTTSLPVVLLNITMLKSFIPKRDIYYSMGGATWYLTLVCFFAAFTPLLMIIIKRLKNKKLCWYTFIVVALFRVIWIYIWHSNPESLWWNYVNPIFRLSDYFLGMILGANIKNIAKFIKARKYCNMLIAITVWGIFCLYLFAMARTTLPWYNIYLRTPLSLGLITLFVCSENVGGIFRRCIYENRFLIYIGNLSFEMFLIHIHVRNIILYKLGSAENIIILLLIFGISLILSQIYAALDSLIRKKIKEHKGEKA